MRLKNQNLSRDQRIETLDALYTAAASLKGRSAMKSFLKDLLTETERIMLGRRILIARMLLEGRTTREIVEELGVGNDTIYRVSKWLENQYPGYEEAVKGMKTEYEKRNEKRRLAEAHPFSYARLKKKYPIHYLLFPKPKYPRDYHL